VSLDPFCGINCFFLSIDLCDIGIFVQKNNNNLKLKYKKKYGMLIKGTMSSILVDSNNFII